MKKMSRHMIRASFLAFCCLIVGTADAVAGQPPAKRLSPTEQKEYETIQKRFLDPRNEGLMNAGGWTLCHCADEKEVKKVEKALNRCQAFADSNQIPQIVEAGGITGIKGGVADLLKNKDSVVRGFGAILLAVIGDVTYKNDIAKLLKDKRGSPPESEDKLFHNFDRSRAAMALGLMGAKEYAPKLSALLRSSDDSDRLGAALGLGYMDAREYVAEIAKLLDDDEDRVQIAAMQALGELEAKEQAESIAKLLTSLGDPMLNETACYTLARLNAKEQKKDLAEVLREQFRKGHAAKALALLGAKEYTKDIAQLVEDGSALVRCDALIALGILDAKEHTISVAAHLQDGEAFVRPYAAVALVLMGDQTHTKDILALMRPEGKDTAEFSVEPYIKLHPVVQDRCNQLRARVNEELKRLSQTENKLQPTNSPYSSPATGSNR